MIGHLRWTRLDAAAPMPDWLDAYARHGLLWDL